MVPRGPSDILTTSFWFYESCFCYPSAYCSYLHSNRPVTKFFCWETWEQLSLVYTYWLSFLVLTPIQNSPIDLTGVSLGKECRLTFCIQELENLGRKESICIYLYKVHFYERHCHALMSAYQVIISFSVFPTPMLLYFFTLMTTISESRFCPRF